MIGRVEETSASFEARSAPRLYPTERLGVKFPGPTRPGLPMRDARFQVEGNRTILELWNSGADDPAAKRIQAFCCNTGCMERSITRWPLLCPFGCTFGCTFGYALRAVCLDV